MIAPTKPDLPPCVRGLNVVLRPLQMDDVMHVAEIQAQAGVARWWGPPDEAQLRRLGRWPGGREGVRDRV